MGFNNRELAVLLWAFIFLVIVISYGPSRREVFPILRTLARVKILLPLSLMTIYAGAVIFVVYEVGVWTWQLLPPTIIWYLTAGLVLYFNLNAALENRGYFWNVARETISISVVIEFVLGLFPFSLPVEFFMQGPFMLLGALYVVAQSKSEFRPAKMLCLALISTLVIVIAIHSTIQILAAWHDFSLHNVASQLLLPVALTLVLLPFLYIFTLIAAYEVRFSRMRAMRPSGLPLPGLLALALKAKLNVRNAMDLGKSATWEISRANTVREATQCLDEGIATDRAKVEREAARTRGLRENTGLDGVDNSGRRLDQREFEETKSALRYLATCHMGHYRKNSRYRLDLLDLLGQETFVRKGLPDGATIHMHVDDDGQRWWAWRRTVSGWVFSIGADGPPPSQWEYDGADSPANPPGEASEWRSPLENSGRPHNW